MHLAELPNDLRALKSVSSNGKIDRSSCAMRAIRLWNILDRLAERNGENLRKGRYTSCHRRSAVDTNWHVPALAPCGDAHLGLST